MYRFNSYARRLAMVFVALLLISSSIGVKVSADSQPEYLWPNEEIATNPNAYGEIGWVSSNGEQAIVRTTDPSTPTGNPQVWLIDRASGQSELLTGVVNMPQFSGSTRYLLYERIISPPGTSQYTELWLRDRITGQETQVDADPNQTNSTSHPQALIGPAGARSISDDGSVMIFAAWNFKVIPNVPSNTYNLYTYDRTTGIYELINNPAEGEVFTGVISGNGRYVLYQVRQSGSPFFAMYRHDMVMGTRQQVGTGWNCHGNALRISQDGSVIAYTCPAQSQVVDLNTMESRSVFDGNAVTASMSNDGKKLIGGTHGSYSVYSWADNAVRPVEPGAVVGYPLLSGDATTMAWTVERATTPYFLYTPKVGPTPSFDSAPPSFSDLEWSKNPKFEDESTILTAHVDDGQDGSGPVAGEYYIGATDPGQGSGTAMALTNVQNGGLSADLVADFGTELQVGTYSIGVRARDAAGNWSAVIETELVVVPHGPLTAMLSSSADTYVRSGTPNRNYGSGQFVQVQSSGNNRSLVKFNQSAIASAVGSGTVLSAKLRLTIADNGNNWGSSGRTVDVHRVTKDWAEGNGTENNTGSGSGATWNCAVDSNIGGLFALLENCNGATAWEMGQPNNPSVHPWLQTPTATQTIINNQTGVVEYDVTADVAAFMNGTNNYGWIIKKTNEGQPGQASFGTKESSAAPELIITYQP